MSSLQLGFECRLVVRSARAEPNFDLAVSNIRQSPREDLVALCPATDSSLLFYAVQRPSDSDALAMCKVLCDELKVCDPLHADRNHQTSLFFAARDGNTSCVEYLLSKGCDPNFRDTASQTALFYAARDGRIEAVQVLVDAGADINAIDHLGQTALFYAARDGRKDTVSVMLEKGSAINHKDRHRRTASFYAHRNNHHEIVALLKSAAVAGSGSHTPTSTVGANRRLSGELSPSVAGADNEVLRKAAVEVEGTGGDVQKEEEAPTTVAKVTHGGTIGPPAHRQKYRLLYRNPVLDNEIMERDPTLEWLSAPTKKIEEFEAICPKVAVWSHSTPTAVDAFYDSRPKWSKAAYGVTEELGAMDGGWIFAKPVDCKAWGCPDYYDIIKKPMDFQTMKKKLKNEAYRRCSEYIGDAQLVFANCFQYNKAGSSVCVMAKTIQDRFESLLESSGLLWWLKFEEAIEQALSSANAEQLNSATQPQAAVPCET